MTSSPIKRPDRVIPVLANLFKYAEALNLRCKASNHCRGVPRYSLVAKYRYLSQVEYSRLGAPLRAADERFDTGYVWSKHADKIGETMLIYKYVSHGALKAIIDEMRVGFALPADLNDLFDQPRVDRSRFPQSMQTLFAGDLTNEELASREDAHWASCAVGSFTRTPDNALMWAHYADGHRGAVIEFDADVAGLTSETLLIPVQFGSMVYMKKPNYSRYGRIRVPRFRNGEEDNLEDYERLQRLFLNKPISWAYEEEVRSVVRTDDFATLGRSLDGQWKKLSVNGRTMWGLRLTSGCITRVFAGARFPNIHWLRSWGQVASVPIERATPSPETWDLTFTTD